MTTHGLVTVVARFIIPRYSFALSVDGGFVSPRPRQRAHRVTDQIVASAASESLNVRGKA